MPTDPTLQSLIAEGHYAIAADRYEEQTGDSELAALMRIEGLEWDMVDGVPALLIKTKFHDVGAGRFMWWHLHCRGVDFGTVDVLYGPDYEVLPRKPIAAEKTPIARILAEARYGPELATRFYQLYCDAVDRVCRW